MSTVRTMGRGTDRTGNTVMDAIFGKGRAMLARLAIATTIVAAAAAAPAVAAESQRTFATPDEAVGALVQSTFAGNRACNNHRWFFKHGFGFIYRGNNFGETVTVDFLYMPVPRLPFCLKRLERHDVFSEAVDLNVVAVDDRDQISQTIFPGKHTCLPNLS